MKKTNNRLVTNEAAVMPSYFKSLKTTESHPLISWEYLMKFITSDPMLKIYTETYRKRLAVSKKFADAYKPEGPGITISAQMDGYGKQLANFLKPTLFMMLDFDHLDEEQMKECKEKLAHDPYVFIEYTTVSGQGIRIFCRYAELIDDDVTILELFDLMIHKAMDYYTQLLGVKPDKACTDITRCAGLAYDPNAIFHPDAHGFFLESADYKKLYTKKANEAKYSKRNAHRKPKASATADSNNGNPKAPTIDEALPHILSLLEQWGYKFEPGSHNDFVLNFGKLCNLYGIDRDAALQHADMEYGSLYKDTHKVMEWCYSKTDKFGSWRFYRDGEKESHRPSINGIQQWLTTRYEFHHNMVTGAYEIRSLMVLGGKYSHWTVINDDLEHSLWREMAKQGLRVSCSSLHDIINSDFSEPFDPFQEYLDGLKPWVRGEHPDYIEQLADRIVVQDDPDHFHTQEWFRYFFKKWLVAMVVAWVTLKVVNQNILILVGKGGIFKTTFFAYLLPPCLRQYFINDSTANYTDKDFQEACSSKGLVCLDEFETIFGKNQSAFKSAITKLVFSIRRPYDKYRSELTHRGSFCGTSNSREFITDEENRRYSPWVVKSIMSPLEEPIDYDHIYAEAMALGKEVTDRKKSKKGNWTFWLTPDDIEMMRKHNQLFMVANYAEEQILRFYRVPRPDTDPQFVRFRYSAEILERIGSNPALRQNLNNHNIGKVMSQLGFRQVHKMKGNGWLVIEKDGAEINTDSFYNPNDK